MTAGLISRLGRGFESRRRLPPLVELTVELDLAMVATERLERFSHQIDARKEHQTDADDGQDRWQSAQPVFEPIIDRQRKARAHK